MERLRLMEETWDCLIILDACRYDYFEQVYQDYIEGELSKRLSAGSTTVEWRDNTFTGRYDDVVYVSANPYINSLAEVKGFLGGDHFRKVYDVWKTAWDEGKGTVLPDSVNQATLDAMRSDPGARVIVHYLQPHAPYLVLDLSEAGFPTPDPGTGEVLTGLNAGLRSRTKARLLKMLLPVCAKTGLLGGNPSWKLRQFLRMEPASPMDAVRRAYGVSGLREAYRKNVEIVLGKVAQLLKYLGGTIIITADHGELLGEEGRYSHWGGATDSRLIEVPWLVIRKQRDIVPTAGGRAGARSTSGDRGPGNDDARIRARLRALGYID